MTKKRKVLNMFSAPSAPGGVASGLQPGGTSPGAQPGATVGSIGTGGGSTSGANTGNLAKEQRKRPGK